MLTLATISAFRDLVKDADAPAVAYASCCGKPRAEAEMLRVVRPHLGELLDLAYAILKIKTIDDEETDNGIFWLRVEMVLDGLDRAQPPARTDLAATLPHLDAGELAQPRQLLGHGRRTP